MRVYRWDDVQKEQMNPKLWRRVISGEKVTVAQIGIARGGVVPTHHHESEQISYVMQGAIQFNFEGKEFVVRSGEALHIPSNVPHGAVALEDFLGLDIFSPIRSDWLSGSDDYLREK